MPDARTVSVVVPTYNQARWVGEAVESALAQTHAPAEVVVVDDGSTDGTADVLAGFGDRIRVLRVENGGVARARNLGAAATTGDALAFLDSDDAWAPTKLARQLERLDDGRIGLVHCAVVEVDEHGRPLAERRDGLEGDVLDELVRFRRPVVLGGGSGLLVPRAAFDAVGRFDERLSTSADWDLFVRIAARWQVAFVDEVLVRYRLHGSNMHRRVDVMEHDMVLAMDKAVAAAPALARVARGQLHATLAGSWLHAGQWRRAVRHLALAARHDPRQLRYALALPLRRIRGARG